MLETVGAAELACWASNGMAEVNHVTTKRLARIFFSLRPAQESELPMISEVYAIASLISLKSR
jgi:hypothetical protein